MRKVSISSILIIFSLITHAQNHIPNGSFEKYKYCPKIYSKIPRYFNKNVADWYSPTRGTPDYFNRCSQRGAGIPENSAGTSETLTGDGYVGLIIIGTRSIDFTREYIAVKLKKKLVENQLYCFRFYISWADYSFLSVKQIGVYFSRRNVNKWFHKGRILPYNPQLVFNNAFLENKNNWKLLEGIYKAEGKEEYIVLGNFQEIHEAQYKRHKVPLKIQDIRSRGVYRNGYYYIDDVSLFPINDSSHCKYRQKEKQDQLIEESDLHLSDSLFLNSIEINEPVVLNNIYFELDKAELLPKSFNELNRLLRFLRKNPQIEIEIAGHTDSTGTAEYNKNLSRARAKAVVEYLKANGIDSTRLSYQGYGSTKPLDDNQTKKGRARNRRVEFIIKKK